MVTHQRKPYLGTEKSLVIGIDVGTTLSGVSYALLKPGKVPRIQSVTRFFGQREGKSKVRSVVCYDQGGNVVAAGPETDPEVNLSNVRRAEWFKLHLCPAIDKRSQLEKVWPHSEPTGGPGENDALGIERGKVEGSNGTKGERDGSKEGHLNTPSREGAERQLLNNRKIPRPVTDDFKMPDRVFTDFLQFLFKSAKEYITETERNLDPTFTWPSIERNTYFVLTHPNGWGRQQQSQMRDAAIAADLVKRSTVADQITFVSEGEASLRFCLDKHSELHQERDGIMVVDCGGGTIGLSAYSQTRQGNFKKIVPPDCLVQGSLFVTSRARDYFKGRFKGSKFGTDDVVEVMARAFDKPEGVKCLFRCSDRPYFVKFGGLRDNDQKYGICGGKFKVEGAQLAKFFEPAVENIIAGIENQRRNTKDGVSIKYVLLVGGFGRSQYLYAKLSDHFDSSDIVILRPDMTHPNKAVADGAVSWYLNHVSTHSDEVVAGHLLDPADPDHLDHENTQVTQANGKYYIPGIFSTILEMDSEVWAKSQLRQAHEFIPVRQSPAWTTVNTPANRGQGTDVNQVQLLQAPESEHLLVGTNQQQREEIKQMKTARPTSADSEQINMLAPPTVVNKADSIFVAEAAGLLRRLNALIEQAASLIADSLIYQEPSKELEDVLNVPIGYIGPWLCNDLHSKPKEASTEPDHLITQIALQSGLVNACSYIINNGIAPSDGAMLSRIHSDMAEVANAWKSHMYTITSQSGSLEINWKYLAEVVLKLITKVGRLLERGGVLSPQYNEVLEEIIKASLELHKVISEDVTSMMEPVTYMTPCDAEFDPSPSRMEDTGDGNETMHFTQDTVICTLEMGPECRKRKESGSREETTHPTQDTVICTLEIGHECRKRKESGFREEASLEPQKVISDEVASMMEPVTYTKLCDAEYDPSRMEDTEGGGDEARHLAQDAGICTLEMGFEYRKRKESGSGEEASFELQKVISEEAASMELVTYTCESCDAKFDSSRMEDAKGEESETGSHRVICTMKMTAMSPSESSPVEEGATAKYGLNKFRPLTKGRSSATIDEIGEVDSKPRQSTLMGLGRMILSRPTYYVSPISPLAIPFY